MYFINSAFPTGLIKMDLMKMDRRRRREKERKKQSKSKSKTQLPHIPEPIILDILSRLPIDSLLRFTIVSKPWRSLILDPNFTFSTPRQRVLIVSGWSNLGTNEGKTSLHTITTDNNSLPTAEKFPHPRSEIEIRKRFNVMGSCRGLLLVAIHEDLFLWNPSTRSCKHVLAYNRLGHFCRSFKVGSGLCYDSSTHEYKAVLVLASKYEKFELVLVGNLRNKSWTKVKSPHSACRMEPGPVVNGLLHWLVLKRVITCFVPETNEFVDLPMPQHYSKDYDEENCILGLGVLEGCLCMVHFDHGNVEVLAMKEHGVKESWTKLFVLGNNFAKIDCKDRLVPLCWTKGGEVLIVLDNNYKEKVMAYNPRENSHRYIRIRAKHDYLKAVTWEESLVSVPDQ